MTPLIICDLDGTLVDSFDDIRHGLRCALDAIEREPTEELLALSRRGVSLEIVYAAATGQDADDVGGHEGLERFVTAYRDNYFTGATPVRAYDGVAETLRRLRAAPAAPKLAVATTKRTAMACEVVERAGLGGLFDLVLGSDDLPKKPDPTLLYTVCDTLGVPAARSIMVGDTDKDVLAARAAGCRVAVAVTYGGWERDELASLGPDHLIDAFSEIEAIAAL